MKRIAGVLTFTGVLGVLSEGMPPAQGQTLSHALPASCVRGQTTRIRCFGKGLAGAKTLWTSFSASARLAPTVAATDTEAVFDLTVPADVPLGLGGIRLATDAGISEVRLFVIDDLPVVVEGPSHDSPASAQTVTLPAAVDGILLAEQSDFYRFHVEPGQHVAIEVVGHRYGNDFDPLIRVLAPDGQEVLAHDNDEGLGFDQRFEHVFEKGGDYVLELRDTRYMGGANWTYHLRMGRFPVSRVAYPLGGTRGRWLSVAFPGRRAMEVPPLSHRWDAAPTDDLLFVPVRGEQASSWVPIVLDDREQQLELESNDRVEESNAFELPRTLHGRLQVPGDVDCFGFQASKGGQVSFRADTRRLSSPADLYLRVLGTDGTQLAVADDVGFDEAQLTFKAPADGAYVLAVEDLHRRGGPQFVYRIEAERERAEFSLAVGADRLVVAQGSSAPLAVQIVRSGFTGPLAVSVESSCPKVDAAECSVPAGVGSGAVAIRVAPDAPLGIHTVWIVGSGQAGDRAVVRAGDASALIGPALGKLPQLPPGVARRLPVLVTEPALFGLSAKLGAPYAARYAKTPLAIEVKKEESFDEEIKLAVSNLPANVKIDAKPIPKGQRTVQLEIDSGPKTELGRFPIFVSGTATFRGRPMSVFGDVLYLDIRPAFALALATPEPTGIARGKKASVRVKAERHQGYDGPIALSVKGLPKGVTATSSKLDAKAAQIEVELTAAADAPAGAFNSATIEGTAQIGGQNETATSSPFQIVIVP